MSVAAILCLIAVAIYLLAGDGLSGRPSGGTGAR
jgi:hypothetical protein